MHPRGKPKSIIQNLKPPLLDHSDSLLLNFSQPPSSNPTHYKIPHLSTQSLHKHSSKFWQTSIAHPARAACPWPSASDQAQTSNLPKLSSTISRPFTADNLTFGAGDEIGDEKRIGDERNVGNESFIGMKNTTMTGMMGWWEWCDNRNSETTEITRQQERSRDEDVLTRTQRRSWFNSDGQSDNDE